MSEIKEQYYIHFSPVEGDLLRLFWLNTLAHDPSAVSDSTMERDECCAASSRRSAIVNELPAGRVDAAAEDDEGTAESVGVGLHRNDDVIGIGGLNKSTFVSYSINDGLYNALLLLLLGAAGGLGSSEKGAPRKQRHHRL
jgi:hypothetical protein